MTTPIPLPNDEQLIWQGQPGRTTLPAAKATICVLTALLLALAVAAAHLLAPSPSLGDGLAEVCSLIRMPFVTGIALLFAAAFILYPRIVRYTLSRSLYIVTDKRLITLRLDAGTGKPKTSPQQLERSSLRYDEMSALTLKTMGDGLCNLYLRDNAAPASDGARIQVIPYLPQDIAAYIQSRCRGE